MKIVKGQENPALAVTLNQRYADYSTT